MEQIVIESLISSAIVKAFGSSAKITKLEKIQERTGRQVHKLTVEGISEQPVTLFSKTGNHYYVKLESALYQRVFSSESMETPKLIIATEQEGMHCIVIEETKGQPIDYTNKDHVEAAFRALAHFHRHNRPHIPKMTDIFTNPPGHANNNPNPQTMFDRIKGVWDKATHLGLTQNDFDIFYDQRIMNIVLSEKPTFVHGDFASGNLLIDEKTMTVRFIDFGYSAIRAGTSDFMQFFGTQSILGDLLELGLGQYWKNSDQGVSYEEFKIRHAYWHGSCYADVFSWKLSESDLSDKDDVSQRKRALQAIQQAGRYISEFQT